MKSPRRKRRLNNNMKITFLGTNGWYDTETGNTPCVLIESKDRFVILDAGFGFYKVKNYIKSDKPVNLFISHLHYDHIIGLHTLPILELAQGLDIYIQKSMIKHLRSFLKRPFTSPVLFLSTKIRFHAITGRADIPFRFDTVRLRHSVPCYGYRFNLEGKTITYCTDTGLCSNLKKLSENADVLIAECAMIPGDKSPNLFHITPQTAAYVAAGSGVKRLALFHFDPGKYPSFSHRQEAEKAAKAIFENTIAANDNTAIDLP